jgi:hypothetical protein
MIYRIKNIDQTDEMIAQQQWKQHLTRNDVTKNIYFKLCTTIIFMTSMFSIDLFQILVFVFSHLVDYQ